jgi:alkanesulfonate monooxygenase SsuD/methylene tetrahydromethanopterin reductase-like flavin-dependent oxidoreductase (luciferase family)
MKFYFFHLMPYGAVDQDAAREHGAVWIDFPNTHYDPKIGFKLYNRYLDEMELADQLGFDGVCLNEHHQTAYGMMPAPDVLAGALARRTTQATICVLGRALPLLANPLSIAEEFAMIDNLTGGRFIAGFVRGIGCEYHALAANPGQSLGRFQEAHDLIIQAWTKPGPFPFHGKYFHFDYVNPWPRPYQQPHPPVWIPSQGSAETIKWAAHPDRKYTFLITFSPLPSVEKHLGQYHTECEEYGYQCTPDQLGWAMPIYVAETDEIAIREARPHIETLFNLLLKTPVEYKLPPGYSSLSSYRTVMETKFKIREQYLSIEKLMEVGMFTCGSAATVTEKLLDYQSRTGFGNLASMLQFATLPAELTEKNTRMFAAEVMPKLRPAGAAGAETAAAE